MNNSESGDIRSSMRPDREKKNVLKLASSDVVNAWKTQSRMAHPDTKPEQIASPERVPTDAVLQESSLESKLQPNGAAKSDRYRHLTKLGQGAIGHVHAFYDNNCDREVAVKLMRSVSPADYADALEQFIQEATSTATLEHPSIISVYNLDADNDGNIYMSMRRVNGHTLKDYVDRIESDTLDARAHATGELLQILVKVCEAVSYAHSQGVIHQDLKPENIMIGDFGEVFVIDWGACHGSTSEIALTPAYMSPQQARGEQPQVSDDVYCLGATFFYCLTRRLPTDSAKLEDLWLKKRAGIIDEPTEEERARIPERLLAIALKAMDRDPLKRYRTVDEMGTDIKNYQSGLAVSAYSDSFFDFFARFVRTNRRILASAASIVLALGVLAGVLIRLNHRRDGAWKDVLVVEEFTSPNLADIWLRKGEWALEDGAIMSRGNQMNALLYGTKFHGGAAVEFEGFMQRDCVPGDLSVVWTESIERNADGAITELGRGWRVQLGAWTNAFSAITYHENGKDTYVAVSDFVPEHDRRYSIRVEFRQRRIVMILDGEKLLEHKLQFPLSSGYVGVYTFNKDKGFDNVHVIPWQAAEQVGVNAIGDTQFSYSNYSLAFDEYARVISSYPDSEIALEAAYKQGLCLKEQGRLAEAYRHWEDLLGTSYDARVRVKLLQKAFDEGAFDDALAELRTLASLDDSAIKTRLVDSWGRMLSTLTMRKHSAMMAKYLELDTGLFADQPTQKHIVARALFVLGRYEDVLQRCPNQRWLCAKSLANMGRFDEMFARYPDVPQQRELILAAMGRFDEMRKNKGVVLIKTGRFDEILADPKMQGHLRLIALMRSGRAAQVLKQSPDKPYRLEALIAMGKTGPAALEYRNHPDLVCQALFAESSFEEVLVRFPEQRADCAQALLAMGRYETLVKSYPDQEPYAAAALVRLGRAGEALQRYKTNRALAAQILLGAARYDEIIANYPYQRKACAEALFAKGEYQEMINEYPEQFVISNGLMALGRYDRVLNRHADAVPNGVIALALTGHIDKALGCHPYYTDTNMRLMVLAGKPQAAVKKYRNYPHLRLHAVRAVELDKYISANWLSRKVMRFEPAEGFELQQASWAGYLLPATLEAVAGRKRSVPGIYKRVAGFPRHHYPQQIWYFASFVAGRISDEQFLRQPFRYDTRGFHVLAKAVRADIYGEEQAISYYEKYTALNVPAKPFDPVIERFVHWRIKQLK